MSDKLKARIEARRAQLLVEAAQCQTEITHLSRKRDALQDQQRMLFDLLNADGRPCE